MRVLTDTLLQLAGPDLPMSSPIEHINLATIGPLKVALNEMLEEAHNGRVSALLEVIPLRSTPANTWGMSSVEGSPIRCASQRSNNSSCERCV